MLERERRRPPDKVTVRRSSRSGGTRLQAGRLHRHDFAAGVRARGSAGIDQGGSSQMRQSANVILPSDATGHPSADDCTFAVLKEKTIFPVHSPDGCKSVMPRIPGGFRRTRCESEEAPRMHPDCGMRIAAARSDDRMGRRERTREPRSRAGRERFGGFRCAVRCGHSSRFLLRVVGESGLVGRSIARFDPSSGPSR